MLVRFKRLSHIVEFRAGLWWLLCALSVLGMTACARINPLDQGKTYYTVKAIHTTPAVVHVGDEVLLTEEHSGSYDGITLGMVMPTTSWTVSRGYFLDTTWSQTAAPYEGTGIDPHIAKRQTINMLDYPHWQAPATPGPVEITCLYTNQAPDYQCKALTITVDVLPAE